MPKNVLVIVPHPDDAEFYVGGTIAHFSDQGARITIAVATDGSGGSLTHSRDELAALRQVEARQAAQHLGAQPPIFLGNRDFELDTLPAGVLREQFMRLIRQIRPDVLIAQDALAADEIHPDHRAVAWAVSDAVNYATLPLINARHREQGLEPHFVLDKYFYSETNAGANYFVDISATIERKIAALCSHQTQVDFMVADIQQQLGQAGLDPAQYLGDGTPNEIMARALRRMAVDTGKLCGYPMAEALRHERFHLYPFAVTND